MKQLIFLLGIFLCLSACQPKSPGTATKPPPPAATPATTTLTGPLFTLDGRTKDAAAAAVANFTEDNVSSNAKTNIWFSKAWVHNVSQLLDSEKKLDSSVDGFRIYFAKENGNNDLVFVSTKNMGTNGTAPSKKTHADYFEHQSAYLQQLRASATDYIAYYPTVLTGIKGARLYEKKAPCAGPDGCSVSRLNYISCDSAYNAVNNFKKKPINTIGEWFPIALIDGLDKELAAAAAISADGIRIYFAKDRTKKRNNLIIVTTKTVGKNHEDYFECYYNKAKGDYIYKDANDHGEECPLNCGGFSWPPQ